MWTGKRTYLRSRMKTFGAVVVASVLSVWVVPYAGPAIASQTAPTPTKPPATRQNLLGMTLSASANEDFFTFFRLQEILREKDAAGRDVAVFKPSGGTFRRMVTVRATLGPGERIVRMELALSRAFIDNAAQRSFANDIASSMLISSLPREDLEAIRNLIIEIRTRSIRVSDGPPTSDSVAAVPRSWSGELPARESPGYLTYAGQRDTYRQQLPTTVLLMEKMQESGEAWVRIQLSPKS